MPARPIRSGASSTSGCPKAQSHSHALDTAFTKRFSNGWQASATYTLAGKWDQDGPAFSGDEIVTIPLAADVSGTETTLAVGDQRHRATFNGIWQLPYQFQLSGLYFFGSGERFQTTYGGDLRRHGAGTTNRLRPDGTIVPRNNFVGRSDPPCGPEDPAPLQLRPAHRSTARSKSSTCSTARTTGSYVTQESNANYGQPTQNTNLAYAPRMLQLGFRFAF